MLDTEATRRKFNEWVRSPAFDGQFNAIHKPRLWPFVIGGVLIVSLAGIVPGIALVIYGFRRESVRKAARRHAGPFLVAHPGALVRDGLQTRARERRAVRKTRRGGIQRSV